MTIIREATEVQVNKLESLTTTKDLQAQNVSCSGECWDCDSCGGSQTH